MSAQPLTVQMHHDLANQFDECFSPADAIQAFDELYLNLPTAHAALPFWKRGIFRIRPRRLRVYRATFAWYSVVVSYVEYAGVLTVIDARDESANNFGREPRVDLVIPAISAEHASEDAPNEPLPQGSATTDDLGLFD